MTAAARLWNRAPLWRGSLIIVVTATILALLYPVARNSPTRVRSTYVPLTLSAVLGPAFHDVAPVFGRLIPLPPGRWNAITAVNSRRNGALFFSRMMLARLDGTRLAGLVVVQATVAPLPLPATTGYRCITAGGWFAWIIPPHDAVQQECWNSSTRFPASWARPDASSIYLHGLQRLREGGIEIPKIVIGVNWFQKNAGNIILIDYFFVPKILAPDKAWRGISASPAILAYIEALKMWSEAWTPLVESGVKDRLQPAEVERVSTGHPV